MKFKDFNLEKGEDFKVVYVNDVQEVHVEQFVAAKDKYDIIMLTLQEALDNGIYNSFKLDMFFHLNIVYVYTDIEFEEDDREDPFSLYDYLLQNLIIQDVLSAMPGNDYEMMLQMLEEMVKKLERSNNSITGALNSFMTAMPQIDNNWAELLQNFDMNQLEDLTSVVQQLGGAGYNIDKIKHKQN